MTDDFTCTALSFLTWALREGWWGIHSWSFWARLPTGHRTSEKLRFTVSLSHGDQDSHSILAQLRKSLTQAITASYPIWGNLWLRPSQHLSPAGATSDSGHQSQTKTEKERGRDQGEWEITRLRISRDTWLFIFRRSSHYSLNFCLIH